MMEFSPSRIMTFAPPRISRAITQLCAKIDNTQTPYYVPVRPESWAEPKECFENVRKKVEKRGGRIQFGWSIWEWPKVIIEAEFHAIWISSKEAHIDITPKPMLIGVILFLPDSKREYDYTADFQRIDNIRRPLSNDPNVLDFIKVSEQIVEFEEKNSPGPYMNFPDHLWPEWDRLQQEKMRLQKLIAGS